MLLFKLGEITMESLCHNISKSFMINSTRRIYTEQECSLENHSIEIPFFKHVTDNFRSLMQPFLQP